MLGNHTDYNEGVVLSCAVAQHTAFALAPVAGTVCRIMVHWNNLSISNYNWFKRGNDYFVV